MKRQGKRAQGGRLFLLGVLLLYGVAFLLNPTLAQNAFNLAAHLLYQLVPALLLVFGLMFVSNLLLSPDWVRANIGQGSGTKGWVLAVIGGILSVGPVYPWYALLRELRESGMRNALIAVFLYSRAIKLPLLPLLVHYFGMAYTLVLVFFLGLFAVLNGVMLEKLLQEEAAAE